MVEPDISINLRKCIITLSDNFTNEEIPVLWEALKNRLAGEIDTLVFDLKATTNLDSSGIGFFIAACKAMRKVQGNIRVINVQPDIMRLFQNVRLVEWLNVSSGN
jgi:anti-anti-sigma factor